VNKSAYTYEEYLAYERDSELKHEFEAGEILDLAILYESLPN
jgi:hypothetical protein